jgi:DNA-nicking Smr family endonuclease
MKKINTPRKETIEDETELFLRAVEGARAIDAESRSAPAAPRKPVQRQRSEDGDEQQLFLQAMLKMGPALRMPQPEPDPDQEHRQTASSRMKQLKRGTIRIREELDLHGHLKEEALAELEQFIRHAYQQGHRAVLVITGKGINSPEGPVLQGAVAAWLRGKGKAMVAEFGPAPRDRGGSGAYVVFLKNK